MKISSKTTFTLKASAAEIKKEYASKQVEKLRKRGFKNITPAWDKEEENLTITYDKGN